MSSNGTFRMDDSVKTQQLLISYAMQKGGWKNMPLPSDWIQITHGNAILYVNTIGCTVLDVHPFKYLALGNDKEKKLVKKSIAHQYDPKKKNQSYISCWATCPFPQKGWIKLYHILKNQILYYHNNTNTLTAKHPSRMINKKPSIKKKDQDIVMPLEIDLQKTKYGKSQNKKSKRMKLHKAPSTPPPRANKSNGLCVIPTLNPNSVHTLTPNQYTKNDNTNSLKPRHGQRRTKSSMEYKDLTANRPKSNKKKKSTKSFKIRKMNKKPKPSMNKTKSIKTPTKTLKTAKTQKQKHKQSASIHGISKTQKQRHKAKTKSLKIHLNGNHKAKNKHKVSFKASKSIKMMKNKDIPTTTPTLSPTSYSTGNRQRTTQSSPITSPRPKTKEMIKKNNRKSIKLKNKKKVKFAVKSPTKKQPKRTQKAPKTKKTKSSPLPAFSPKSRSLSNNFVSPNKKDKKDEKEMKQKSASNLNGYNWNSPYTRSLSKSLYMYAASRGNNVLFPIQNKSVVPVHKSHKTPNTFGAYRPKSMKAAMSPRTRASRSNSLSKIPPKNMASISTNNNELIRGKSFKTASPNKRRRNAVGMSSEIHSKLLEFNGDTNNEFVFVDNNTPPKKGISITLGLGSLSKRTSQPSTPTLLIQSKTATVATEEPQLTVSVPTFDKPSSPKSDGSASDLDIDLADAPFEIKSNINGSNSDEEKNKKPPMIKTIVEYTEFQTAGTLVVRDKVRSSPVDSVGSLFSPESLRTLRGIKPRSRSHSRKRASKTRRSRANSAASTSSRGSVSSDQYHRESRSSSPSNDSSDESSVSSVSRGSVSDSSSDSDTYSHTSSDSRRSSVSSRSSVSRSTTPVGNKRRTSTTDKMNQRLINSQSSLLGNMANMMMLMSQQQLSRSSSGDGSGGKQLSQTFSPDLSSQKSLSGFVNINDVPQVLPTINAKDKATMNNHGYKTEFDEFMNNFMANFNSSGNTISNNNVPVFSSFGATTADNNGTVRHYYSSYNVTK